MKRRRIIVFAVAVAVAVALAFAGGAGPRHARAAQNHDHAAVTGTTHSHEHSHKHAGGKHSHEHGAASLPGKAHDHAGNPPVSDQGCCYAWCNAVAVLQSAEGSLIGMAHDEHFASEQPFQIVAFSAAIDPPPR